MKKKESIFTSTKDTFVLLAGIMAIFIVLGMLGLLIVNHNYFSQFGDDNAQYFPIMNDFVLRLKANKLSFFSYSNYVGSSIFVDTYYITFDVFSFLTVLLSNVLSFKFAFGFTEMIKLFLGVLLFGYYLYLRKRSNKAIFFGSLLYAISGANVTLMVFPVYYSLIFYLPLSAVIIHFFQKGKRTVLPLLVAVLMFYNYYNCYMLLLFMALLLLVHFFTDSQMTKENWNHLGKDILLFIGLGILGVMMGAVVLIPSAYAILNDTTKGSGFNLSSIGELFYFKDPLQYLRTIGNIFTPSVSTDYWGFSNNGWLSYVNMHLSLYITVTGLLVSLNVYFLRGRESLVYKVIFPLEVLFLTMPLFYMLFSGSTGTYARWFVILSFFNILIFSYVVSKTDFDFYLIRYKILIRNVLVLVLISVITVFYVKIVFGTSIWNFLMNFGRIDATFNSQPSSKLNLTIDCYMLLFAILAVIIGTIDCFVRKVNLIPYLLAVEIAIGGVFFYMAPYRTGNFLLVEEKRGEINSYLDKVIPYQDLFYRIYLGPDIDKGSDGQNYNRTNLNFTTFKNFHSWHTAVSHEYTHLVFGTSIDGNASHYLDYPYFDIQQMFGERYVVVNKNEPKGLPYWYQLVIGSDDDNFLLYENTRYTSMVVYNSYMTEKAILGTSNTARINGTTYEKAATLLNYLYYLGDNKTIRDNLIPVESNHYGVPSILKISKNTDEKPWFDLSSNYLVYHLDLSDDRIPSSGVLNYNFDFYPTFSDVYLEYKDDNGYKKHISCYSDYSACYYKNMKSDAKIYIKVTPSIEKNIGSDNSKMALNCNYIDYSYLDDFFSRQATYFNKFVTISDSKITVHFERTNTLPSVILIPIAYSDAWVIDKNYEVINCNGGLIGVYLNTSEKEVTFSLKYNPPLLKESSIISFSAFFVYGLYLLMDANFFSTMYNKWKKRKEA